jgi:ATP-dependent Lon protease
LARKKSQKRGLRWELRAKIASQAQTEMSEQQRDYLLRAQIRAVQQELGEQNPEKAEVAELRRRRARCPRTDRRPGWRW